MEMTMMMATTTRTNSCVKSKMTTMMIWTIFGPFNNDFRMKKMMMKMSMGSDENKDNHKKTKNRSKGAPLLKNPQKSKSVTTRWESKMKEQMMKMISSKEGFILC